MNKNDLNYIKGYLILFTFIFIIIQGISKLIFNFKDNLLIIKYYLLALFILLIFLIKYLIIKKIYIKNLDINYIRELPKKYSMPVMAYLYNKNVNIDHIIMTLKLKFKRVDKELLSNSERYVFDWLNSIDRSKYSIVGFRKVLSDELKELELSDKNAKNISIIVFVCLVLAIGATLAILSMSGYIPYDIYDKMLNNFIGIGFILFIIYAIIYKMLPPFDLYSKKGKKEHLYLIGFYKFLKEFTCLNEREMTEYPLWNEYLEYAVLFGINNNYLYEKNINILTNEEFDNVIREIGEDKKDI